MNEKDTKSSDTTDIAIVLSDLIPGVYVTGCLVLLVYAIAMFGFGNGISKEPSDWGTLGDYFGGLMNPVISFATLMVAYAVWKQQREELKATKEALEEQAKTAEQQRQEQRFFDLLRVYTQTLDSYTCDAGHGRNRRGKEAVSDALVNSPDFLRITLRLGFGQIVNGDKLTHEFVASLSKRHGNLKNFNVYLRVVFQLLEEAEPLLGAQHKRYVGLFKSQLSDDEVRLIGLFCWVDPRCSSKVALIEKYGLLEHFPEGPLRSDLINLVGSKSFCEEGTTPC